MSTLIHAALHFFRSQYPLAAGQAVSVVYSTEEQRDLAGMLCVAAREAGAVPLSLGCPYLKIGDTLPKHLVAGVMESDVCVDLSWAFYGGLAMQAASAGVLYFLYCGVNPDVFIRLIAEQNLEHIESQTARVQELTRPGVEFSLQSALGTDFSCRVGTRPDRRKAYLANLRLVPGQTYFYPEAGSGDGKVVFDGALFPPEDLGVLRRPVTVTFENGRVTQVQGGSEAQRWKSWLDQTSDDDQYKIAHISLGMNPGATHPIGNIVADERVMGAANIGIGPSGQPGIRHTDGVSLGVTVRLDGALLIDEGLPTGL